MGEGREVNGEGVQVNEGREVNGEGVEVNGIWKVS